MKSSYTRDGSSIADSQINIHKSLLADQANNSIQTPDNKTNELRYTTIKISQNSNTSISHKKSAQSERVQINTQLNNLLNFNRRTDSLESTTASSKARSVKNTNLSISAFKPILTTSTKRSSISKKDLSISNLPTEMNSLRTTFNISLSQRTPVLATQKIAAHQRDKILRMHTSLKIEPTNVTNDFKCLKHLRSTLGTNADFVPNMKFPYDFRNISYVHPSEDLKSSLYEDKLPVDSIDYKKFNKWKEAMKKKKRINNT